MNEPTGIELRPAATALTPEVQILLGLLAELPVTTLIQSVHMFHYWQQAPASQRALALKLLDDQLSDKQVAQICGLSTRQLRRYPHYRCFVRLLRENPGLLPRGSKNRSGQLEAWAADE